MYAIDFGASFVFIAYQAALMVAFTAIYTAIGLQQHFTVADRTSTGPLAAAYFSVVTQVTTGYGDIYPKTDFGRVLVTMHLVLTWVPFLIRSAG
jgi:hypothetical protein